MGDIGVGGGDVGTLPGGGMTKGAPDVPLLWAGPALSPWEVT